MQITHAVGNEMAYRPKGRPSLYGRPVKGDKSEKDYEASATGRRRQLV